MRLAAGDVLIDLASREVRGPLGVQTLEPRAAAVLAHLLRKEGEVVSRSALIDTCWPDNQGSDEALSQTVAQLRRALGDEPRRPRYIATVYKSGYRWLSPPMVSTSVATRPTPLSPPVSAWARPSPLVVAGLLIAIAVGGLAGAGMFGLLSGVSPRPIAESSVDRQVRRTFEDGRLVERETVTINRPET